MQQARELPNLMASFPKPKSMEARKARQRNLAEALLVTSSLVPDTDAERKLETAEAALDAYRYNGHSSPST